MSSKRLLVSRSAVRSGRSKEEIAARMRLPLDSVFLTEKRPTISEILTFDPTIIWCHFDWEIDKELILRLPNLVVIATTSTGDSHIDTATLKNSGKWLVKLERGDRGLEEITATVELSVALITGMQTGLLRIGRLLENKSSSLNFTRDLQLSSSRIGLIGAGRIGERVGVALDALGCSIRFHEIAQDRRDEVKRSHANWEHASLESIFETSNLVSIHASESCPPHPVVTSTLLQRGLPNLQIVNTSRPSLVDYASLLESLESEKGRCYATDVDPDFSQLPYADFLPRVSALAGEGRYLSSPHIGGASREAAWRAEEIVLTKL